MTTCKETIGQFHEFLDNELDEKEYSVFKQHIDMCHKCCKKIEFEQSLKKIVKDKNPYYKTPRHVLENIVTQWAKLDDIHNHTESPVLELERGHNRGILGLFTLRPAFVTMAILLPVTIVGLSIYLIFLRPAEFSPIVKTAAERHDSFVNDNINLDLVSSDRNAIRKHFNDLQRSNIAIDVPDYNGNEIKSLGCKYYNLAGKKSAYVGLKGNQDKISLEIVNGSDMNIATLEHEYFKGRPYYFGSHKGYNVVLWREGNSLYSLTSTMNRRDLMRVASESIRSYNTRRPAGQE